MKRTQALVVAVVALVASGCAAGDGDESILAGVMCEEFISEDLPPDAELETTRTERVDGANRYDVGGKVAVPSIQQAGNYVCELEYDPDAGEWTLLDSTLG